jgi:hypothetical protein
MAWTTRRKAIAIAKVEPHVHLDPSVVGRAPGIATINFSPLEFYGAAARCSHRHLVNPAIVTGESQMIEALVTSHVDDVKADFEIEASADGFKDYVKSYFAGTVATGLSYLAMVHDGYVWSDHFENLGGGSSATRKTPDFVFSGYGTGVALVESKGSRSGSPSAFEARVRQGYIDQVEPHLGHAVGRVTATHGYCIGAYLPTACRADLRIHHTAVPVSGAPGGDMDSQSLALIQRGNYARAFALAHSADLGRAIRAGEARERIPFVRFGWRGRKWLTSRRFGAFVPIRGELIKYLARFGFSFPRSVDWWPGSGLGFAIDEQIALAALSRYLRVDGASAEDLLEINVLELDNGDGPGEQREGAAFPDGLAAIGPDLRPENEEAVVWERNTGEIHPS